MPFNADYLTDHEVDDVYLAKLKELERLQLHNLLLRIIEPLAPHDQYDRVTRALQSVEEDWRSTKRLRQGHAGLEMPNGVDSG